MKSADKYSCYKHLAENECLGKDYRIQLSDVGSPVSVIAPHGGRIEPNSCEIARKIAGQAFNCYCFEGLKNKDNKDLHITSHRFDEPRAVQLVNASEIVVTIHAMKAVHREICIGGKDKPLAKKMRNALNAVGLKCRLASDNFAGVHPKNICNRGKNKQGVQLEISRGLRDSPQDIDLLSDTISMVLKDEVDFFNQT